MASGEVTLRSYQFIDSLQPQLTSHICSTCKGFFPTPGVASLFIEIAPGMQVHRLLDRALKATNVSPAMLIVERAYGMMEVHHDDKGQVLAAGQAVLDFMELNEASRMKPKVVSNEVIRATEPYHAMIIDKLRFGSMIEPGESLLVVETVPAAYIAFAANEAEKAARVKLVEIRTFGAFGRLYMSGSEAEIDSARAAAEAAIVSITGVEKN
ncbi:MAG: hypothetical protein HY791_28940 [Deltaproteobacteria bacterium]|nr:hypothetical protein [Deltaproteobacteria bacterium]